MKQQVIVDKHLLERLEEDRLKLFKLCESICENYLPDVGAYNLRTTLTAEFVECTGTMWELSHRKWEEVKDEN